MRSDHARFRRPWRWRTHPFPSVCTARAAASLRRRATVMAGYSASILEVPLSPSRQGHIRESVTNRYHVGFEGFEGGERGALSIFLPLNQCANAFAFQLPIHEGSAVRTMTQASSGFTRPSASEQRSDKPWAGGAVEEATITGRTRTVYSPSSVCNDCIFSRSIHRDGV